MAALTSLQLHGVRLFGLVVVLALSGPAHAQRGEARPVPRFMELAVLGLDDARTTELGAALALEAGTILGPEDLRRATSIARSYLEPGRQLDIKLDPLPQPATRLPGGVVIQPARLVIRYIQLPVISDLRYFPLFDVEAWRFRGWGTLERGDYFSEQGVEAHSRAIAERARELGAEQPEVTLVSQPRTTDSVVLGFVIEDAARKPSKLRSVSFEGAGWFGSFELRGALGRIRPVPFTRATTVTAGTVAMAERATLEYLRDEGWLDARVHLESVEWGGLWTARRPTVTFRVDRGERYRISETRVIGARRVSPERLATIAEYYVGEPFSKENSRRLQDELETYGERQGYVNTEAVLEYGVAPEKAEAAVLARIEEYTTTTLGEVVLEHEPKPPVEDPGAFTRWRERNFPPVRDEVILRRVRVDPGERLTWELKRSLRQRLGEMNSFDRIRVDSRPSSDPYVSDLLIGVRDKRSGNVSLSLGVGGELARGGGGLFVGVGLTEHNVGGRGDRASLSFRIGENRRSVRLSYFDRDWLFGERLLGSGRELAMLYSTYYNDAQFRVYLETVWGAQVELQRTWPLFHWRFHDALRLRFDQVRYRPDRSPGDYEEDFSKYLVGTARYRVYYDSREAAQFVKEGLFLQSSLELGDARGFLAAWDNRAEHYQPLARRWIWAALGQFAMLLHPADQVGLSERLHGGGNSDLRGFNARGVGPVDPRRDELIRGGATKILLQNELRFMLTRSVALFGFVDNGAVSRPMATLAPWRVSAGGGVRFRQGENFDLAVTLARALVYTEGDDRTSVHIGVGLGF